MLAQRPHRADRDDVRHAEALERVDVGAVVDLRGRDAVAAAVPRQKDHAFAAKLAHQEFVRWAAEGRLGLDPTGVFQPLDVIDAATPDHCKHDGSPLVSGPGNNAVRPPAWCVRHVPWSAYRAGTG